MPWPLSQDYNEGIQSPTSSFDDSELRAGQPVTGALGLPMPRSGNFADVYEFTGASGAKWAIKCFTRAVPGLRQRYTEISKHLIQAGLPFMVDFEFLERGIRVRGDWYPVLKMKWVEGALLNEFVATNLEKPAQLEALSQIWQRMARCLRDANMAHADLQHGNVLLVPGRKPGSLAVKLIDYDGMWVPALAGIASGEVGHPAYQHPQRLRDATYSADVDRFPVMVVYVAIRALMTGGRALWERFDNGDNLLFRRQDLETPSKSALFAELLRLGDPSIRLLAENLIDSARKPLEQTPLLDGTLSPALVPAVLTPTVATPSRPAEEVVATLASPLSAQVIAAAPPMVATAAALRTTTEAETLFSALQPDAAPRRKRRIGFSTCLVLAVALALGIATVAGIVIAVIVWSSDKEKMQAGGDLDINTKKQAASGKKALQTDNPAPLPKDAGGDATAGNKAVQTENPAPLPKDAKLYLSHVGWFDWGGYGGLGKGTTTADSFDYRITVNGVRHPLALGMHPEQRTGSHVKFLLRGLKARMFISSVAVDDNATPFSPLTFVVLGDGKPLWESKPVQKPRVVQDLSINVSGIEVLELRVNCPGAIDSCAAVWVDPFITTSLTETELDEVVGVRRSAPLPKGAKLYLSHVSCFYWTGYNGFGKGTVTAKEPGRIIVNGIHHPLGLGMHLQGTAGGSYSRAKFLLRGLKARMFTSSVAVNDTSDRPESPLTFAVWGDDKPLWESKPVQKPHIIQECSVNVSAIEVLELRVNCPGGYGGAHAVWLDPCITTTLTETELDEVVGVRR